MSIKLVILLVTLLALGGLFLLNRIVRSFHKKHLNKKRGQEKMDLQKLIVSRLAMHLFVTGQPNYAGELKILADYLYGLQAEDPQIFNVNFNKLVSIILQHSSDNAVVKHNQQLIGGLMDRLNKV